MVMDKYDINGYNIDTLLFGEYNVISNKNWRTCFHQKKALRVVDEGLFNALG
jgi:hypothetical protein